MSLPSASDHAPSHNNQNLSDTDADDEEEVIQESNSGAEKSRQVYIGSGNDKKVLYLLCVGLNRPDRNEPLFLFEIEPWSLLPKSSIVRPKNVDYVNEIMRRAELYNTVPVPRARNWSRVQTMEWLQQNPICDHADIEFLTNEVLRVEDVLIRKAREQQETNAGGGGRGHWRGSVPYLRLIMCLTQDNVKCLFLTRANSRSRQELDARNSDRR